MLANLHNASTKLHNATRLRALAFSKYHDISMICAMADVGANVRQIALKKEKPAWASTWAFLLLATSANQAERAFAISFLTLRAVLDSSVSFALAR